MKNLLFPSIVALCLFASCADNGRKPTVFIPCVVTGDNPTDRSECECRTERRIHQRDTAYYRDAFFEHNAKQGRTFWAAYIYAF
jgi:hypothetical protein